MTHHSISTSTEAKHITFLVAVLKCQQKQLTEGEVYSVQSKGSVHCNKESISDGSLRKLITFILSQEARMLVFMVPPTFQRLGLFFSDNLI